MNGFVKGILLGAAAGAAADMALHTASGKRTKSEELGVGESEFTPWPIGVFA